MESLKYWFAENSMVYGSCPGLTVDRPPSNLSLSKKCPSLHHKLNYLWEIIHSSFTPPSSMEPMNKILKK